MTIALLKYRDALHALCRGDARALSAQELSQTISFARISLIVGLVFLHYETYPNSTLSPFRGLDVAQHQVATFVNSFVLFFFFSVVPLLSMVSGWLFFSFTAEDAADALRRRMRRRFFSLYVPLVFWNALFLAVLAAGAAVATGAAIVLLGFRRTCWMVLGMLVSATAAAAIAIAWLASA